MKKTIKQKKMKYDTLEKKIATVKKKGNIITFKKPYYPRGTANQGFIQILITGIKKEKSGAIKLEGMGRDSDWYKSIDELIQAVDFEQMEAWHSSDEPVSY